MEIYQTFKRFLIITSFLTFSNFSFACFCYVCFDCVKFAYEDERWLVESVRRTNFIGRYSNQNKQPKSPFSIFIDSPSITEKLYIIPFNLTAIIEKTLRIWILSSRRSHRNNAFTKRNSRYQWRRKRCLRNFRTKLCHSKSRIPSWPCQRL